MKAHFGDPCIHCGTPHDDVAIGPCPGRPADELTEARVRAALEWADDGLSVGDMLDGESAAVLETAAALARAWIANAAAPPASPWRPTHLHVKSGGLYRVVTDRAMLEATATPAVIYSDAAGMHWCRAASEFYDGRFQPLDEPPAEAGR